VKGEKASPVSGVAILRGGDLSPGKNSLLPSVVTLSVLPTPPPPLPPHPLSTLLLPPPAAEAEATAGAKAAEVATGL
jgi:hypothetical protein